MQTTKLLRYSLYTFVFLAVCTAVFFLSQGKQSTVYTAHTFNTDSGWAYEIRLDKKVIIHQEFVPAVQGIHPFRSASDARRTGELVAAKMNRKQLPSVTVRELDSLHIQY